MHLEEKRQTLLLLCRQCSGELAFSDTAAACAEGHTYEAPGGLIDLLSGEEREALAPFLGQYETVRSAERWGDGTAAYYQHLPFRDITGLHTFEWRVKSASYTELLKLLTSRNAHTVLDVGAGNCWLSHRLWMSGFHGAAIDIRSDDYDGLSAPARYWPRAGEWLRVRTTFDAPAFAPEQFDAVVFNAALHYSRQPAATLEKYFPLLRNGGALYVIDSPVYRDRSSGEQMMREREAEFRAKYGIEVTEETQSYFLTFDDIHAVANDLTCSVKQYSPKYGWKWRLRPVIAGILRRREPASFGVFVFEKG